MTWKQNARTRFSSSENQTPADFDSARHGGGPRPLADIVSEILDRLRTGQDATQLRNHTSHESTENEII